MRHGNHRHQLGVKKAHRFALVANLAVALFTHGRIKTTLAKAKALRPFAEKVITLAKKAAVTEDLAQKLHYRRLAIARIRDEKAVALLFDTKVNEFLNRSGGYTRIYKLIPRQGDAASMALIDLIEAGDEGYSGKRKRSRKGAVAPRAKALAGKPAASNEDAAESDTPEKSADENKSEA